MKRFVVAAAIALAAAPSFANDQTVTYPYEGSFEDAAFAVESAIVGRGLMIDYVSHTGEMLSRTAKDVGSDVELFKEADIFLFCSAIISRKVMEADPMNIAHCPYGVFVAEKDDKVFIGHRRYPAGVMQEVEMLLSDISKEASE